MKQQESQEQEAYSLPYIENPMASHDSLLSKHLDASEIVFNLKMMLLNKEKDPESGEWKTCTQEVQASDGKIYKVLLEPLMDPQEINALVGFLQSFLNPNTFLSKVDKEEIKETMWHINIALMKVFYRLRDKITADTRDLIWVQLDNTINLALNRAEGKNTLDAISKMQQSVEHIESTQKDRPKEQEFKVF